MRKHKILLLSIPVVFCLTACGGVSRSEYDAMKSELSSIKEDYDKLDFDYKVLEEEIESLKTKNEDKSSSTSDSFTTLNQRLQYIPIESWGKTCYEGRFTYLRPESDYSTHQVIIDSDYSSRDINTITDEVSQKISVLSSTITDDFKGETIYVKYLDSNGTPIVEYQFSKEGKQFKMTSATLESTHLSDFIEILGGN